VERLGNMRNILVLFCLLLTIKVLGQEDGDLRFNENKNYIEIYVDCYEEESIPICSIANGDSVWWFKTARKHTQGWFNVDTLYTKYGDYFHPCTWGPYYDIRTIVYMRKLLDVLLDEKIYRDYYYFYINGRPHNDYR
jgi:hypothetical protein